MPLPAPCPARPALALGWALATHGLFLLGVGTMVANLFWGMRAGPVLLPGPAAWAWDLALVLAFPVGHSGLLSRRGRGLLRALVPRSVGATLDTTVFAALAAAQVWMLFALWAPLPGPVHHLGPVGTALSAGAAALAWGGLGLAMAEAGLGVQLGTLGWRALRTGRSPRFPAGPPARGLHGLLRHPIYLCFAAVLWAGPVWSVDRLVLGLPLTLYCLVGPRFKVARHARRRRAAAAGLPQAAPVG